MACVAAMERCADQGVAPQASLASAPANEALAAAHSAAAGSRSAALPTAYRRAHAGVKPAKSAPRGEPVPASPGVSVEHAAMPSSATRTPSATQAAALLQSFPLILPVVAPPQSRPAALGDSGAAAA